MKLSIEVDCTPEEARAFFGLPDVGPVNQRLVDEMQSRITAGLGALPTDDLLKSWLNVGAGAQEQFRKLLATMTDLATRSGGRTGKAGESAAGEDAG